MKEQPSMPRGGWWSDALRDSTASSYARLSASSGLASMMDEVAELGAHLDRLLGRQAELLCKTGAAREPGCGGSSAPESGEEASRAAGEEAWPAVQPYNPLRYCTDCTENPQDAMDVLGTRNEAVSWSWMLPPAAQPCDGTGEAVLAGGRDGNLDLFEQESLFMQDQIRECAERIQERRHQFGVQAAGCGEEAAV
eukprot:NODE_347_length_3138_cov_4.030887.p3 GENE.NODE_347_length_3138_cov_4.030887~~NODE_347_length_3138_cov_4.030887.p3  ORF type:complete len:195 (-),score=50.26 NODE_347_length_3138_cov_4.030887:82-666(-)